MDLSAFLLFSILTVTSVNPGRPGQREALHAYYKYTGMEASLNKIEREQVPRDVQTYIGSAVFITNVVSKREITLTFKFP